MFLYFELRRYYSMKIKHIIGGLILFVLYVIGVLKLFSLYMKHLIPLFIDIENIESNKGLFYFINSNLTHIFIYYLINIPAYLIYSANIIPKSMRMQEYWPWEKDPNDKSSNSKYNEEWKILSRETIKTIIINQLIIIPSLTLPNIFLNRAVYSVSKRDFQDDLNIYLSWDFLFHELFPQFLFCLVLEDLAFYIGHSLLHTEYLYKKIHKQHHSYKSTVTWAAEHAHPLEFVFGNIIPTILGSHILREKMRPVTQTFFIITRILKTSDAHSGVILDYNFFRLLPFSAVAKMHNLHHEKFKGNYGSYFSYWDFTFGTFNKKFVDEYYYGKEN